MESTDEIESKEVTWQVLDIPVFGTVTMPKDKDIHPAVVLLAGSGPTDRDWCSPLLPGSNGTGRILAEALAKNGYVTLRYDKIGSGPRAKESLHKIAGRVDMRAFTKELLGGVERLVSEKCVDNSRLYALTNSEGAIHAINYCLETKRNSFKGLVLTGAPGRSINEVARTQFLKKSKDLPKAELLMKHYDEAIGDFLAARPIRIDPSLPREMELLFRSLESPYNLPFSRELWTYDLAEHIKGITDPILIIIGKKDIQVDWQLDGKRLENATVHNPQAKFAYPDNANHILKYEEAPREKLKPEYVGSRYNAQDARLDIEVSNIIFDWLGKQSKQTMQ